MKKLGNGSWAKGRRNWDVVGHNGRKTRDKDSCGGTLMGNNSDNCVTDTIPIPLLDVERKALPVFCPWCNRIATVAKADVMRYDKISPSYMACRKCGDFIDEGRGYHAARSTAPQCWGSLLYIIIWLIGQS